jgi:hypothetical protein
MRLGFAVALISLTTGLIDFGTTRAEAQATRTWVSGVGDDVNPCTRAAPCKTFAAAISKTPEGGVINCIDAVALGKVTITKSITLDCDESANLKELTMWIARFQRSGKRALNWATRSWWLQGTSTRST